MADIDNLKIAIDRDECIGDGACVNEAPETFELDDDDKAVVKEGSTDSLDSILEAARNCPTECIVIEEKRSGKKLFPEE